jgi:hypothetical protein
MHHGDMMNILILLHELSNFFSGMFVGATAVITLYIWRVMKANAFIGPKIGIYPGIPADMHWSEVRQRQLDYIKGFLDHADFMVYGKIKHKGVVIKGINDGIVHNAS